MLDVGDKIKYHFLTKFSQKVDKACMLLCMFNRMNYKARSGRCSAITLTQREDLPHEDTEGPNVALSRVDFVKNGLGCHPLERQSSLSRCRDTKTHLYCT